MSEDVINANPTVIDISDLPTRLGSQILDGKPHNEFLQDLSSLSLTSGISDAELSDDMDTDDEGIIDHEQCEEIDAQEIFDLLATMSDPEHPLTLAQLAIVNLPDIKVKNGNDQELSEVLVKITPTITHCSLATLIGLGIRVRLERCLPPRFRIRILLKEGTHQSENQVNKQLNDKERVAAACENDQLLGVISQMLSTCK